MNDTAHCINCEIHIVVMPTDNGSNEYMDLMSLPRVPIIWRKKQVYTNFWSMHCIAFHIDLVLRWRLYGSNCFYVDLDSTYFLCTNLFYGNLYLWKKELLRLYLVIASRKVSNKNLLNTRLSCTHSTLASCYTFCMHRLIHVLASNSWVYLWFKVVVRAEGELLTL